MVYLIKGNFDSLMVNGIKIKHGGNLDNYNKPDSLSLIEFHEKIGVEEFIEAYNDKPLEDSFNNRIAVEVDGKIITTFNTSRRIDTTTDRGIIFK